MKKFTRYNHKRAVTTIDDYGQLKKGAFQTLAQLQVAVFLKADSELNNNPLFSEVTHIGVYKGNYTDFQKKDRLDDKYEITQFIKGNRKVLLYLKECVNEN